jgi:hypothetical protein
MAWLNDVIGGMNNMVGGSGNAITQLLSLFGANQAINKYNVATPAENTSMALYKALLDPNSKIMANMTGQLRQQNLGDFQTQLQEMQLADRRAAANGHAATFFQPERADETVNYLTSRGLPQLNNLATQQAIQRIASAASGINGFAPAQTARQQVAGNNMINNYSLPEQIMKMFSQGGFQNTPMQQTPMQSTYYPNTGTQVNWNR